MSHQQAGGHRLRKRSHSSTIVDEAAVITDDPASAAHAARGFEYQGRRNNSDRNP
ncbi:hypothetical protein [Rhodococcus sp. LB1]|uniref:hypothetical protein n=1 Tax=Rhodococcus sp. LB1 TaxID=1807499 RepID=UPI000A7595D8|nr:hypothetical protein [Rhodococcus sp. LB1]